MYRVPTKLLGWKSVNDQSTEFYKCPKCGNLDEMLPCLNGVAECYKCGTKLPINSWGIATEIRPVAVCVSCNESTSLTPIHRSMFGAPFFICSNHDRQNILAIESDDRVLAAQKVLSFDFAPELQHRAEQL